jgi:hypothetical protein
MPPFESDQVLFLEANPLGIEPFEVCEFTEGLATPEVERATEAGHARHRVRRGPAGCNQTIELLGVDHQSGTVDLVPAASGCNDIVAQRSPHPANRRSNSRNWIIRPIAIVEAPLDELIERQSGSLRRQQGDEKSSWPWATEIDNAFSTHNLDRPKKLYIHVIAPKQCAQESWPDPARWC